MGDALREHHAVLRAALGVVELPVFVPHTFCIGLLAALIPGPPGDAALRFLVRPGRRRTHVGRAPLRALDRAVRVDVHVYARGAREVEGLGRLGPSAEVAEGLLRVRVELARAGGVVVCDAAERDARAECERDHGLARRVHRVESVLHVRVVGCAPRVGEIDCGIGLADVGAERGRELGAIRTIGA